MRHFLLTIAAFLLLSAGAAAQSQSTSGNIEGRITDSTGAVVPNVTVTATNKDTGFRKNAQSDSEGNYVIVLLPPGIYTVEVAAAKGFAAVKYENVRVTVGAKYSLNIELAPAGTENVVNVSASGESIELTRTSISTTINENAVQNLPTNGRNFLDFAVLTPGITRDPTRAGDLAVGGQKGTLNSIQIDGASSDNTFFGQATGRIGSGRAPSQFSIDTVKEFQVNQNGFSAEFGRAAGAVINVVTKSGTNRFSGSAFEYFRDESLNARNPNLVAAGRPRPAGQINQFGGTFGGPFKKDKAFFFGAYEGQRSKLPNPVVLRSLPFAPPAAQAIIAPKVVSYDVSRKQDTFLFKTDFNINERNQAWIRFNQQNFTGTNLENAGTLSALEHTGNSNVTTTTLTTNLATTIRPNWINEFRFQYSRDREPGKSNSTAPETAVTASAGGINDGTFFFGRNNFSPRETTINRYQFIDNQTYIAGRHTIKYGVDLLFDRILNFFPGLFSGSYTFTSYAALAAGTPSRYRQSFAGPGTTGPTTHPNNYEYGGFVQDDWRATRALTLNFGLRYDYQQIAKPPITNPNPSLIARGFDTGFQPKDKNNFAPRFGMSYAFNDKTVLRGGYGLFYGRTPAIMTGTAHSQNGIQVVAIDINCTATPALCPVYPNIFSTIPTGATLAPVNLYLFGPNYRQPFTQQGRIQFERELFKHYSLAVRYTVFRGESLSRTRNANLSAPVPTVYPVFDASGSPTGQTLTVQRFSNPRPIPAFQRISLFESSARSFYQGLTIEFNRRLANHWQFITSYTLSKAKDDKPDQTSVVPGADDGKVAENNFDLSGEYGRSDLDVRHRFIFSPVYETGEFKQIDNKVLRAILSDYVITGIFTAQSGFAYSALVSGDPNADGNSATDRAPGTLRNQFTTPNVFIVDMRVGKIIRIRENVRLTLFGEGFNLFNRSNVQTVNNTLYTFSTTGGGRLTRTTNFGTPRTFVSGAPSFTFNSSYNREFQLGIRLDF
ncbi:MAG: TonB-dependent receptor [Acidobacteriota bacterium]|jgi:outer membrane receptor protein involved in Fe transport